MDHGALLLEQNRLLADLLGEADWSTPVPTCPGWTLTQIMRHVGRAPRWATTIVRTRAQEALDPREAEGGRPPADRDGALAWFRQGPRLLLEAVADDPEARVWTTAAGLQPARWWVRRLHEAVVHWVDAAIALGVDHPIEPALAADGISEWLDLLVALPGVAMPRDGSTMHLHATDEGLGADGEWTIRGGPSRIDWEHGHGFGDVALSGNAADLLLAVMRRIPGDDGRLVIAGEREHWTTWLANTAY
ncbi:maleylpyruvate isomerase family mycothiol-dependent enzyme [Frankia sp. CNm7]|uniref:Maleylpyruvate isomerase family mycothiol-dependent enzyme n=1 Tax=Frankia nepalensis TaxID=1836974 RepID=A0A937RAI9_9ACTN|nr:maleylpyruvate isomerase family mycothiol-dependent enzyme [Frankia nepalensis]MBL7496911.1 maleylpyruvate isomerase family mycothiol-dependent enzyme [Frankia nepalensis]MBL7508328.1 maleylpyruvate isomerase family mycothiol-dependent enzyme [Frankia nepalensis]MBL7524410.1 maleylpyruvate isomerase family mycothiol-dependent enzyme [Frankia nepalensis]MBL7626157.1 maleylpyruvate isomerase family mycothiol-dependent enzyme [Frankia nepalensis]